ncbi:hypothetical protein FOA52_007217 [Chlamydomonas sp. UWO 241]|nr:hypothetical protein FOA52_007217 [Chlamydomonas sp. UWO 241]
MTSLVYKSVGLPLDVMWSDIDFMDRNRVFTYDPVAYPPAEMAAFVDRLHEADMRWVPILDPGVVALPGFGPYERGLGDGSALPLNGSVFISDRTGKPYLGTVWSGPSHWVDWLHPRASEYWLAEIASWRADGAPAFDGLWIDMNEPSNFCTGDVCVLSPGFSWDAEATPHATAIWSCDGLTCSDPPTHDPLYDPPYAINNKGHKHLADRTVPPTAVHWGGVSHYNAHSLFSIGEAKATYEALLNITGKRPFVLSRATFPGQGRFSAHWSGDNAATWEGLRQSVAQIVNSNFWGLPLIGADICGFTGDSNEELCARWMSAGAFYPFARNHADKNTVRQEPYQWPSTLAASKRALSLRYQLTPYLYTCFFAVHAAGGTVARAPLAAFPGDARALAVSPSQWLLGDWLMVAPVMVAGASAVDVYFPQGTWFSAWEDARASGSAAGSAVSGPVPMLVPAPIEDVPVFVRAGGILPMAIGASLPTTAAAAAAPLSLLVALPPWGTVAGGGAAHGLPPAAPLHTLLYMQAASAAGGGIPKSDDGSAWWALAPQTYGGASGGGGSGGGASASLAPAPAVSAIGVGYFDDGDSMVVGGEGSTEVWWAANMTGSDGSGWLQAHAHGQPRTSVITWAPKVEQVTLMGVPPPQGRRLWRAELRVGKSMVTLEGTDAKYAPRAGAALGELTIDLRAVFFPGEPQAGVPPGELYLTWSLK